MSRPRSKPNRHLAVSLNRAVLWIGRHWLAVLNGAVALFVLGAILAPAFMKAGYSRTATLLYTFYGFTCHQLPQRSYFLFGRQLMYPLEQLLDTWPGASTLWQQRAIVGNPVFGYKVALATRCSAIYPTILLAGLLFSWRRKAIKPLSIKGFILLSLPMALDGGSHFIGEITRLDFRYANVWLQTLTQNAFAPAFYVGDAFGSFNWLMRTITGALFGLGLVWATYPILRASFDETQTIIKHKFKKAGIE
jgi:uncharacterized membrane protein